MVSIGMVVVTWGNYMSEWIPKFIIPRPSTMGVLDQYARWLVNPSAPSGTGDTPVEGTAGPYQSLIGPPIINMNDGSLFSIPALGLHFDTEVGGNMEGLVQFWDDDAEIYEQLIATLSASVTPEELVSYSLPGAGTDDEESDGTYVGDWEAVTTPIPAGSGYLYGGTAGGASGGSVGLRDYPASADYGMNILCRLELGDAGGNVLVSVDLSSTTFQCDLTAHSTSTVEHLINTIHPISWGAPITQERCVAVISGMYGTQTPYGSAGISTYIKILRTS